MKQTRPVLFLACGAVLGGLAAWFGLSRWVFTEIAAPAAPRAVVAWGATGRKAASPAVATASAPGLTWQPAPPPAEVAVARCEFEPVWSATVHPGASAGAVDPARARELLRAGKASIAAQRPAEAESALVAACRLAALPAQPFSVLRSDAQGLLGQLYAQGAADGSPPDRLDELDRRAQVLLEASASGYLAVLGPQASKTVLAQSRLAALLREPAQGEVAADARPTVSALAAPADSPDRDRVPIPRLPEPGPLGTALQPATSSTARGQAPLSPGPLETEELAANLRRLAQQAASVSDDPEGFRRRAAAAQARADACRDNACLQRWYARRRAELLEEF